MPETSPTPPTTPAPQRVDYSPVLTLLILVAGCLAARALGADELSIALGSGALGYAGAQRGALSPGAARSATALVFVVFATASTLAGCGALSAAAPVVKTVLDGARWTCGVVEPICRVATQACDFVPGTSGPSIEAMSSGGESEFGDP